MKTGEKDYYRKNATHLGWGESARLDNERINLLDKFLYGKRVLDVACGKGLYVDYLAKQGYRSAGVDLVDDFIDEGNSRGLGEFFHGRAEKLPFEDKEFDSVLLFDILEHGDDKRILQEAKRVSKKRIIAIVPKEVEKDLEQSGVIYRHYLDRSHLREYQKEDLQELAEKCSLKLVHSQFVHPLYNETIFFALFEGNVFFRKVIRKIAFRILKKRVYPTEIFAVFDR